MSGDATVPQRSILRPNDPESPKELLRFLTELRDLTVGGSSVTVAENTARIKELTFLTY